MLKHIFIASGITIVMALCMVYPFLPGPYDALAQPVSIIIQAFGIFGLLLSIVGLLWLLIPKKQYSLATTALYLASFIVLIMACIAFFSSGKLLCAIVLMIWSMVFFRLRKNLQYVKNAEQRLASFIPFYLIVIPVFILIIQLLLAQPLTQWSRNKAIESADGYINDLAAFKTKHGLYPQGVQALHKDYLPNITAIEKYHYLASGDSYNLSFEQPRFLLDAIGTRELVVYNPVDNNTAFSHASWFMLIDPAALEGNQGWYDSGIMEQPHWKYFLFD